MVEEAAGVELLDDLRDDLDAGQLRGIVFLEVKTGGWGRNLTVFPSGAQLTAVLCPATWSQGFRWRAAGGGPSRMPAIAECLLSHGGVLTS